MKHTLFILLALTLFVSCQKKVQEETVTTESVPQGPQRVVMELYNYTDSVPGTNIRYTIHREPDSTLAVVEDEFGDTYVDNYYQLTIKREGTELFSHRFTKASFSNLSADLRKTTIFDGFRFVRRENGLLQFSVCVSEPNSDLSVPFILSVGPDGSYTIAPDNTPDLEEEEEGV